MNKLESAAAARAFIRSVTNPDKEWKLSTVEANMPGHVLHERATQSDFFPVTVKNVARAINRLAVPA